MPRLGSHQRVRFQMGPDVGGVGRVVGLATTEIPFMGHLYIIEMDNPAECGINIDTYPYPCIAIPELSVVSIDG